MSVQIKQLLDALAGGGSVPPVRIAAGDGAITAKAYDRIYVDTAAKLTTLTASDDSNLLTLMSVTADTDELPAGFIFGAGEGLTIKAITVMTGTTGVVWGITYASSSV